MNESINLAENRSQQLEREQKFLNLTRIIAVLMLTVVALISITAFIISSQIPLLAIKQAKQSTIAEISALHTKLATYYLLKDRIGNINLLLAKRKDYTKITDAIYSKVQNDVSINGVNIEENSITLNFSSNNLLSIDKLINDLIDFSNQKKLLANLKLQSLSLDAQSQTYSLMLIGDLL